MTNIIMHLKDQYYSILEMKEVFGPSIITLDSSSTLSLKNMVHLLYSLNIDTMENHGHSVTKLIQ